MIGPGSADVLWKDPHVVGAGPRVNADGDTQVAAIMACQFGRIQAGGQRQPNGFAKVLPAMTTAN